MVVDDFLQRAELKELKRVFTTPDEPHWNKNRNTGALKGTWDASLPYDGQKPLPEISKQIARKIHRYALKHLAPNPTLPGSMKWRRHQTKNTSGNTSQSTPFRCSSTIRPMAEFCHMSTLISTVDASQRLST